MQAFEKAIMNVAFRSDLLRRQGKPMGLIYTDVEIENTFMKQRFQIRALVDTGCMYLSIPEELARALGFDTTEAITRVATLADGSRREVPQVGPIRLYYGERYCDTFALVLGNEPLLGVYPLEGLDLTLNPTTGAISVNEAAPAKGYRVA
jgi:clan AA aspartic protease